MSAEVALVVVIASMIHALWNVWLRAGNDRLQVRTVMVISSSGICAGFLPFLPFPVAAAWPCLGFCVATHLAFNLLLVRMYREGDLSVSYPIFRGVQPFLATVGGILFASEVPSAMIVVGIALVTLGVFLLINVRNVPGSVGRVAVLTGFASTVATLLAALGVRAGGGEVLSFTSWVVVLNGLPLIVVYWWLRPDSRRWQMDLREWLTAVGGGFISTVAFGMMIWALQHGELGAIAALRETTVVFGVLFGWVLLREKLTVRKALAALLILAGSIAIYGH